jgi:hypothetical protein
VADQNLQPQDRKKNNLLFLEVGLIEIGFVILGLIIVFGTLNYFNILPVSKTIPFLSFLPTQSGGSGGLNFTGGPQKVPAVINKIPTLPPVTPSNEPFLACPIASGICKNGKVLVGEKKGIKSNFKGLGFSGFSENQAILAATDGSLKVRSENNLDIVTIENQDSLRTVTYEMPQGTFRQSSSSESAREGQVLGRFQGPDQTINNYGGNFNLIFYSYASYSKIIDPLRPSPDGDSIFNSN